MTKIKYENIKVKKVEVLSANKEKNNFKHQ